MLLSRMDDLGDPLALDSRHHFGEPMADARRPRGCGVKTVPELTGHIGVFSYNPSVTYFHRLN